MKLTVNIKNVPSEVNRPYIVVRFCNGELWYYGQYDDVERANDVAEGLGMATVFDNSSYNAIEALEQEPIEVEATKLQMAYNQGFEDCRKAVMDLLSEAGKLSLLAMVADLASINPQDPKYCDRNICIKNEYNGIGCDECEVTKSQEPKTGHWIYDKTIENWRCSKCNETPKIMGYVGTADFMAEHFKFCNHCGAKMGSEEV